ncbi:MAG: LamG domain-containing protein, partial [Fimbriimonadaceae bacterium]|nr:LamG domain-containing protein [Chitinophagales bacterium]
MKNKITCCINRKYLQKIALCFILICSFQFANAQVPTVQQQLYITFGGGSLTDLSPNAFSVTPTGAPFPCPDRFGNPNCALQLAATDYLTIQVSNFFDITAGEDYSISMWYRGYTGSISDLEMLFNKTNTANSPVPSDYHLCIYDLNKPFQGYNFSPVTFHATTPGLGWHHLVAMYDNIGSVWTLYIDNVLIYNFSGPVVTSSPSDPVQIGGGWPAGVGHVGRVDDIVFYDRLLTVAEINQLFIDVNSCAIVCGCP